MKSRQEIKALAKEAMGMQRGNSIVLMLVYFAIVIGVTLISMALDFVVLITLGTVMYWMVYSIGMVVITVISMVLGVNLIGAFIKIYKRENTEVGELLTFTNPLRKVGGMLWMALWVWLWSLLLVIPGIIKGLAYYFTANVLADCPNVSATQAIKISMRITKGHKGKVFLFILSWIGWFILSSLTLGILFVVYVGPYFYTADAGLYLELRDLAIKEGRLTKEELGMAENIN